MVTDDDEGIRPCCKKKHGCPHAGRVLVVRRHKSTGAEDLLRACSVHAATLLAYGVPGEKIAGVEYEVVSLKVLGQREIEAGA
jgi:hypothetical protein